MKATRCVLLVLIPVLIAACSTKRPVKRQRGTTAESDEAVALPAPPPPPPAAPVRPAPPPKLRPLCSPTRGEPLRVVGVASDDVLNVRAEPTHTAPVLGAIPSGETGVSGFPGRKVSGGSRWREVGCGQLRGWVNERFVAADEKKR